MKKNTETVPPGIAALLKSAKTSFWMNVVVLTVVLGMMLLMLTLNGPAPTAKKIFLAVFLLALYTGFLIKVYSNWQEERQKLLGKKRVANSAPGISQPKFDNPNTAPTSRIDVEEMKKKAAEGSKP